MPDPRPQAADADFHRMVAGKPGLQFNERDIAFLRHLSAQRLVIGRKLRLRAPARLMGPHIAGRAPPAERLVDVRHADPKQRRGRIHAQPAVHRRHHPIPKVLRISHTHDAPQRRFDRRRESWPPSQKESPDSVSPENALADGNETTVRGLDDVARAHAVHPPPTNTSAIG